MPPIYESLHRHTSNTLAPENPLESEKEDISVPDEGDATSYLLSPSIHGTLVPNMEKGTQSHASTDALLLGGIFVILVSPWIFLAIVWSRGGVQMPNIGAELVIHHPQIKNFLTTLVGNIVGVIVSLLFSLAVIRLAQEWVTNNDRVTVFDVSLISAFRRQIWPWRIKDYKYLFVRNRWWLVILTGTCLAAFALVAPGATSLITPVPFYRTTPLTGSELDLSSNVTDCVNWFNEHEVPNNLDSGCTWATYHDLKYTNCAGGAQLIDVLESGRNNMISTISNNSESLDLGQLGANSSHHFLGPVRGTLPFGPNDVAAFDTSHASPLDDARTRAVILSYNYTLDHQGLSSNVSCIYDTQSPITVSSIPNNTHTMGFKGTCDGLDHVFAHDTPFSITNGRSSLAFWACKSITSAGEDPVYYIYLRGRENYATAIGNITCTVSIQPAIFPVMYESKRGIFSTKELIRTSGPGNITSICMARALIGLGSFVVQSQSMESNLVAESVIALGVQSLGLSPNETNKAYLPLYAAMIQGILVNQVAYTRFIYSTVTIPAPPLSCIRTVNGTLSAEVIGWLAKPLHIGFLMPMTILNVIALGFILIAMFQSKGGCNEFDPTDPRPLVLAAPNLAKGDPSGWTDGVSYRRREELMEKNSA